MHGTPTSRPQRVGSLDIEQNLDAQGAIWGLQRVVRALIVLFVVAGVLGVFGGGWFGRTEVRDPGGRLAAEYPRYSRVPGPYELRVEVTPGPDPRGEVAIWLDHALTDALTLETIQPEPYAQESDGARTVYRFRVDGSRGGEIPFVFHGTAEHAGRVEGVVGLEDGPTLQLRQFFFP